MSATRRRRITVINPNSNQNVTDGVASALDPIRFDDGPEIVCRTLVEGPIGIEKQADVEQAVIPLSRMVAEDNSSDAFVIACYSDPGIDLCREVTPHPVFGINECGVATALARGDRFGVIAVRDASVRRHLKYLRQLGLMERLAGERALDMSVAETASGKQTLGRMIEVGEALRDKDGADVVVMGCAGMARHRAALEHALGVPVIDPCQAAVAMAVGTVQFN